MTEEEILKEIEEAFYLNYERLRLEGGHALSEDIKRLALEMVIRYWKKMPEVAEKVTDTEVKISLPEQRSPHKRKFSIEGIVDILKEEDETWMYDIKTHDGDYVRKNKDVYEKQLNVYSHIWSGLRGEELDHMAIIALSFPPQLSDALRSGDEKRIESETAKWEPLVDIPFNQKHVDETIKEFGEVVDDIENNVFSPPALATLKEKIGGQQFATRVCRNCDARFSCPSYRKFALGSTAPSISAFKKYIEDLGPEFDVEGWMTTNLEFSEIPEIVNTTE